MPTTSRRKRRRRSEVLAPSTPTGAVTVESLPAAIGSLSLESTPKFKAKRMKRRVLFPRSDRQVVASTTWSERELEQLTAFVMLHTDGTSWVAHKDLRFWASAGQFIQRQLSTSYCRTGYSCRSKIIRTLSKKFATPADADRFYTSQPALSSQLVAHPSQPVSSQPAVCPSQPTSSQSALHPAPSRSTPRSTELASPQRIPRPSQPVPSHSIPLSSQPVSVPTPCLSQPTTGPSQPVAHSQPVQPLPSVPSQQGPFHPFQRFQPTYVNMNFDVSAVVCDCRKALVTLQPENQLEVISVLFSEYTCWYPSSMRVSSDFLKLLVWGMQYLKECNRSNVVRSFVQAIGTKRPDGSDSLLPLKRMPMGLIEYVVNFFNASSVNTVSCPPDYRSWLQTMYILFGTKWAKIFSGPMWSHESIMQVDANISLSDKSNTPIEAFANVPALSDRTLRRDIVASGFTTGPEIQVAAIEKVSKLNPDCWWWVKGDGTDVVKGLWVSVKGEWSGDVDLNDGKLQQQQQDFRDRICWTEGIGLTNRSTVQQIKLDLTKALKDVGSDLNFINFQLQKANSLYEEKLKAGRSQDQVMFGLCWDVEELKTLTENGRQLRVEVSSLLDVCTPRNFQCLNIPRKLASIREQLCELVRRVSRFKRVAATHVFVIMISQEPRDRKPYAVPVQCIPYVGITEGQIRRIMNELIKVMVDHGMKIAGCVTDGEFNFLRSKGYTRPLSVLQLRTDVRNKYAKIHHKRLLRMLMPKLDKDGFIVAEECNPAVPHALLEEIWCWREDGMSTEAVVDRLRPRTVPPGYLFHTWRPGETEGFAAKLRSVLAQLEYGYRISEYERSGIDFRTYLYIPEDHPVTKMPFCEHEDDAHILKRIANHTRSGGPEELKLERFVEALSDASSGLTYPALVGSRKQSVIDAERLFSPNLAEFMKSKGYDYEAKYIEVILNWRRSCDERGLSELTRSKFNYEFLNFILDELMPWHRQVYDFSLLEVNRSLNVLGFSRETLVALVANIEGREWRRIENLRCERKPEHPRASSTDDVECFFSMMRDSLGKNFTTKEVKNGFRKVSFEFSKRLDPDLPFYYHTSSHTRYYEGPMPDFSVTSSKQQRKNRRVPRREQPAAFAPRRATMPVRGSLCVRPKFHNLPLELPPPPTGPVHVFEHSYS